MNQESQKQVMTFMKSPLGPLKLIADRNFILSLQVIASDRAAYSFGNSELLTQAIDQLNEYFFGTRRDFKLPIRFFGSIFQQKVWEQVCQIPYGQVSTYSKIAQKIGAPQSVRAVGNALGRNPLLLLCPCHRVIAKDGTLGGFSAGLNAKRTLLELESLLPPSAPT